jgi:hypothetical protein
VDVRLAARAIALDPRVGAYETAVLTVAGPEKFWQRHQFRPGEPVVFNFATAVDEHGQPLDVPDGVYKWELHLVLPLAAATQEGEQERQGEVRAAPVDGRWRTVVASW